MFEHAFEYIFSRIGSSIKGAQEAYRTTMNIYAVYTSHSESVFCLQFGNVTLTLTAAIWYRYPWYYLMQTLFHYKYWQHSRAYIGHFQTRTSRQSWLMSTRSVRRSRFPWFVSHVAISPPAVGGTRLVAVWFELWSLWRRDSVVETRYLTP